jgi:hypothetical protein
MFPNVVTAIMSVYWWTSPLTIPRSASDISSGIILLVMRGKNKLRNHAILCSMENMNLVLHHRIQKWLPYRK